MNHTEVIATADWISALTMLGAVGVFGTVGNLLVVGVYLQHLLWPNVQRRQRQQKRGDSNSNDSPKKPINRPWRKTDTISISCAENLQSSASNGNQTYTNSDEQLYKHKTGTPTFFIIVLACVDLMVCCFVVPITFYLEFVSMQPESEFWCKAHAFVSVCNTMFSSLLVIAIALDRYFAICHPLYSILTMHRAKWLTFSLAVFCVIYGLLGQWTIKLESKNPNIHPPECIDTIETSNITLAEMYFYQVIQKGNTACFVLSILFVLILYSLILRVVIQAQRRIERFHKEAGYAQSFPSDTITSNALNTNNESNQLTELTKERELDCRRSGPIGKMRLSIRGITESGLWREIRSASVLFVVAVVYIIVFTPSLLMANNIVSSTLVGYNSYFLNNMSNPLIYCFMSKQFRRKLKSLFELACSSHHEKQDDIFFVQSRRPDRRALRAEIVVTCTDD